jgi:putative FmdB family regulatory protein
MPTYEYYCSKCNHKFEVVQSMKDAPLEVCPKALCGRSRWGKGKVKRLIGGGAGIIFKGSGFYVTDYRSASYQTGAKKESDAKGTGQQDKTGGSSSGKPDSKPIASPSVKPTQPT